jgi:uncharacterized integral membrane protein
MWIIRWILITFFLLALVGFMGQNQNDQVSIKFFIWETRQIGLAYALFLAFGLGVVLHLLFSLLKQFQLQAEIGRLKRQIRKLHEELEQLRNLAIEEDLLSQQISESEYQTSAKPENGSRKS